MPANSSKSGFRIVPGSERQKYTRGQVTGPCDGGEPVRATVMVRRKNAREFERLVRRFEQSSLSDPVQPLTLEELRRVLGADPLNFKALQIFPVQTACRLK